jgi:hypothetical protein
VGPTIGKLRKEGIEVTALHNHLIGETPRIMFLHVAGKGSAARMAMHLKEASSLTGTPMEPSTAKAGGVAFTGATEDAGFDIELIQKELGHTGKVKDGVLQITVPRPEAITSS